MILKKIAVTIRRFSGNNGWWILMKMRTFSSQRHSEMNALLWCILTKKKSYTWLKHYIELDEPVYNSDIILFFYADLGEQGGRMKWKVCLKVLCTTLTQ